MPVQWVNRPNLDFRGFSGLDRRPARSSRATRCASCPRARPPTVAAIVTLGGELDEAVAGQSVTLTLADEIDCSRGDVIAAAGDPPEAADQFEATIVWMADEEMLPGRAYWLKLGTQTVSAHGPAAEVPGQRQHDGASRGQDAGAERDRRRQHRPTDKPSCSSHTRRTATSAGSS